MSLKFGANADGFTIASIIHSCFAELYFELFVDPWNICISHKLFSDGANNHSIIIYNLTSQMNQKYHHESNQIRYNHLIK